MKKLTYLLTALFAVLSYSCYKTDIGTIADEMPFGDEQAGMLTRSQTDGAVEDDPIYEINVSESIVMVDKPFVATITPAMPPGGRWSSPFSIISGAEQSTATIYYYEAWVHDLCVVIGDQIIAKKQLVSIITHPRTHTRIRIRHRNRDQIHIRNPDPNLDLDLDPNLNRVRSRLYAQ